jgi:hypothetical protein
MNIYAIYIDYSNVMSWQETDGGVNMKDINFLVSENPFEKELKKEKKSTSAVRVIVLVLVITVGTAILLAPGYICADSRWQGFRC